ncbi:hypothetical protein [Paenibacillus taichungensis]|uniref:hypothetical protein n=1 Tax=Paenibacillus taichungensis TaxID=484184 RepID=UPI00399F7FD4
MLTVSFHTDPRGAAYEQLIDELIEKTARFLLVDRGRYNEDTPPRVSKVLRRLQPYLIESCTMEEMMMQSGAMYSEGIYYIYRCTPESGQILKEEADRFHDWLYPSLPDDLCFLKQSVFKLPLALFELITLEELEIMTADLENIPKDISHLKQLQRLTIYVVAPTIWCRDGNQSLNQSSVLIPFLRRSEN